MAFLLPVTSLPCALDLSFKTPPLDGSYTIPELYDWHLVHNPTHRVFIHSNDSPALTFADVVPAIHRAGWYVSRSIASNDHPGITTGRPGRPVVAIFAACDTVTYLTTLVGAMRAGITVHPISPRFSAAVVAHLLAETRASHIFVGVEVELQETAEFAIRMLQDMGRSEPAILSVPMFTDLYHTGGVEDSLPPVVNDYFAAVLIVHSSGSTSYPKPIVWNTRTLLQNALSPLMSDHNMYGQVFGCHAVELFHAMGLFYINWIASMGIIMATFPPMSPAVKPTAENMFEGILETNPSYILAPPIFIRTWARDSVKVQFLSTRKGLMFGGRILSKPVGDFLANSGVPLYTVYGMTEVGLISAMLPENHGSDWEYFRVNPHASTEIVPCSDGNYEMIAISRNTHELTLTNTFTSTGEKGYATGDIFAPHPTRAGYYKVIGRADDQIMLSTGDILDPHPLEDFLSHQPSVSAAVIFGRGRSACGVIIEPTTHNLLRNTDALSYGAIWREVRKMNKLVPGPFARVSKDMILVAHPDKKFTFNAKGVPQRANILKAYELEVDAMYEAYMSRKASSTPIIHL